MWCVLTERPSLIYWWSIKYAHTNTFLQMPTQSLCLSLMCVFDSAGADLYGECGSGEGTLQTHR